MSLENEKELTANQLYKIYKDEGGVLSFSEWLNREKAKGVFPLNGSLNNEIMTALESNKNKESMKRTVLGFPVSVLVVTGIIIIGAVVYSKYYSK